MGTIVSTVVGVLAGAIITWFFAWYYYKRAGEELNETSREIVRLTTLVLRGLEEGRLVRLTRDSSGRIAGLVLSLGGTIRGTSSASASLDVGPPVNV